MLHHTALPAKCCYYQPHSSPHANAACTSSHTSGWKQSWKGAALTRIVDKRGKREQDSPSGIVSFLSRSHSRGLDPEFFSSYTITSTVGCSLSQRHRHPKYQLEMVGKSKKKKKMGEEMIKPSHKIITIGNGGLSKKSICREK